MLAARSASTDKDSARKARNTLLLHMVQLGLTLSSTMCLSALIYGLRDQTIRSTLMYYLCCRQKRSVIPAKAEVSS
ncbi:hypothetical protein LDENG_00162470 [Lucifuga dentata]|nr:hypothetical protein LDENG_00162470 [Lucifuga dentata]